jgi:hypothetical protein
MTQLASICQSLLKGEILSIMNGFHNFGCTNLPREIGRGVERKFGALVQRQEVTFKSRYNHVGIYYEYKLDRKDPKNKEAIKKMKDYIKKTQKLN